MISNSVFGIAPPAQHEHCNELAFDPKCERTTTNPEEGLLDAFDAEEENSEDVKIGIVNVFSTIPTDVLMLILPLLSLRDLKAMMAVDRWNRATIPLCGKKFTLINNYRFPPLLTQLPEGTLNKLDMIAASIERIPLIGYISSIPRMVGGLFCSIGFGIGEGVSYLRANCADTDNERLKRLNEKDFCEEHAVRGAYNLVEGFCSSMPLGGMLFANHNYHVLELTCLREHCMSTIEKGINALDWTEYTLNIFSSYLPKDNGNNFPSIELILNKRDFLTKKMHTWKVVVRDRIYHNDPYGFLKNGGEEVFSAIQEIFDTATKLAHLFEGNILNCK